MESPQLSMLQVSPVGVTFLARTLIRRFAGQPKSSELMAMKTLGVLQNRIPPKSIDLLFKSWGSLEGRASRVWAVPLKIYGRSPGYAIQPATARCGGYSMTFP